MKGTDDVHYDKIYQTCLIETLWLFKVEEGNTKWHLFYPVKIPLQREEFQGHKGKCYQMTVKNLLLSPCSTSLKLSLTVTYTKLLCPAIENNLLQLAR